MSFFIFQNYVLHWMWSSSLLAVCEIIIYVILSYHKDFKKGYSTLIDEIGTLIFVGVHISCLGLVGLHHKRMSTGEGRSLVQGAPAPDEIPMNANTGGCNVFPSGDRLDQGPSAPPQRDHSLSPPSYDEIGPPILMGSSSPRPIEEVPDRYRGGASPLPSRANEAGKS